MKIYRRFDREYSSKKSQFNHVEEGNVLYDFIEYCGSLNDDFKELQKNYESFFDADSKISLKKYYENFIKLYNAFTTVCFKDESCKNSFSAYYMLEKLPEDVLSIDGEKCFINEPYYSKLKALAEQIFKIEAKMADTVEKIWLNDITSSLSHNFDKYSYLVHANLAGWRRQPKTKELDEYSKSLIGVSSSYINQSKTKFFKEEDYKASGLEGYILKIEKGAFICGCNNDVFATEYVNGKCEYIEQYNHSAVRRIFADGQNEIYACGTKICTPSSAINSYVGTVNEILLDKRHISLERAFYTRPQWDMYKEGQKERLSKMVEKTETNEPLALCSFNKLNQLDIQVLYDM